MNLQRIGQNEGDVADSPGRVHGRGDELDLAIVRRRLKESELDYSSALDYLVVAARWITGSDGAAIAMAKQGDAAVKCVSWHGIAPLLGTIIEPGSGISGLCLSTGQSVLCTNTQTDNRVDSIACEAMNIKSIATAPVFREQAVVGLIEVFSSQTGAFDGATLEILSELALLVADVSATEDITRGSSKDNLVQIPNEPEKDLSGPSPTVDDSPAVFSLTIEAQRGSSPSKVIALVLAVVTLGAFGFAWITHRQDSSGPLSGVSVASHASVAATEPGLPPPIDSSGATVKPLPVDTVASVPTFQPPSNAPLEDIRPAKLVYRTKPTYPAAAMQAGITGRVTLQAKISSEGRVTEVHVLSGAPILADAAKAAVRNWRYRTTEVNGHPIESSTNIVIDFPERD